VQAQASSADRPVDVSLLLDSGRWTAYQKALTLLAALAIVFDGFDIQILGFAIPSIMHEWHVARASFGPISALGLAGMAAGSPFAGFCGDRYGRRVTLIGCVVLFGAATVATAFCHGLLQLGVLRAIAGVGVGGALPNAGALTAEFAPMRRRALAVTLTIVCVPLGGMVAGIIAARVLPALGWRALYTIGGAAPLLFALILLVALPESPRYLARRPERRGELARLLSRMGHRVAAGSHFDSGPENWIGKGRIRALWISTLLHDTAGLWLACFSCMTGVYLVFGWLPAMLAAQGLNVATASSGLAAYNFGGVLGVLICAAAVTVLGSRRPLLWASAAGAAAALALMFVHIAPTGDHTLLIAGIGLQGLFVNAVQTTIYALASHVYPTSIRSTGVACAAAVGRVGGIASSLGGAMIIQAGSGVYLMVLALAMAATFAGLAIVRNHYPGRDG
jgi:AAHS family 4-hydroxybenzoate transporter-like MFS transporter